MKRTYLSEFEEIVLLTVAVLNDAAYGVAITDELEAANGPFGEYQRRSCGPT